jgi:hypothetical protein
MSRLQDISEQFRKENIARNEYRNNDVYEAGHPNALSDGDEKGKGRVENSIGSSTDIAKRKELQAKNAKWFTKDNPYDASTA